MPLRRVLCALVLGFVLASCGTGRPEVARVGDRDLGEADLRRAVALQRALADLQGAPCGTPATPDEPAAAACDRAALSGELLWLAVSGYAERNDLTAPTADAEEAVAQLEAQVGEDALAQALATHEVTRDDLLELGRRILTFRAVRTAVAGERVGADELRAQYDERVLEFTTVRADHILVRTQQEAQRVYRRVRDVSQSQFETVAREVSTEPGADQSGGDLGEGPATRFAPEFARAVAALNPGEVSAPVRTQFGWHVIYLVDKRITPFGAAKDRLLEPLADQEFRTWLVEQANALDVQVNPRYGRFVAETFSVQPARSTDPSAASASPTS
jgi:peptidyl-prolyl cis-trans isomerase C